MPVNAVSSKVDAIIIAWVTTLNGDSNVWRTWTEKDKKGAYFQEVLQTFVALKKWLVGPVWSKCLCLVLVNKLCLKVIFYIFLYLPSFSCLLCVVNQWYYKETDFFLACERQTFLLSYRRWGKRKGSGDERGETSALRRLEFFYFEEIKFQSLLWFWE